MEELNIFQQDIREFAVVLSEEFERDSRRYNRAKPFEEEEE